MNTESLLIARLEAQAVQIAKLTADLAEANRKANLYSSELDGLAPACDFVEWIGKHSVESPSHQGIIIPLHAIMMESPFGQNWKFLQWLREKCGINTGNE